MPGSVHYDINSDNTTLTWWYYEAPLPLFLLPSSTDCSSLDATGCREEAEFKTSLMFVLILVKRDSMVAIMNAR